MYQIIEIRLVVSFLDVDTIFLYTTECERNRYKPINKNCFARPEYRSSHYIYMKIEMFHVISCVIFCVEYVCTRTTKYSLNPINW